MLTRKLQQIYNIRKTATRFLSLSASCNNPSIGAFRTLLRAAKETFQSDEIAVKRCRDEARRLFILNAQESDGEKIKALVAEAFDAAVFLRESIVQARLNQNGVYEMKVGATGESDELVRVQEASSAAADGEKNIAARTATRTSGCGRPEGCGCAGEGL